LPTRLKHLGSDFTGTRFIHGKLVPSIKGLLSKVSSILDVHVLTADTFGMAQSELADIRCVLHILIGDSEDIPQGEYVDKLGAKNVVALGNGSR
jgi:hypothetical protein